MNKTLRMLAIAGVCAVPLSVQAQADVSLYGVANVSFELVSGKTCPNGITQGGQGGGSVLVACSNLAPAGTANAISDPTVTRVSSNASRFGIRGSENLGAGVVAFFQLESNVSVDTGNSSASGLASRQSWLGLRSSLGQIKAGYFFAPLDDLESVYSNDYVFFTTMLSTDNVWAFGELNKGQGGFDNRDGNSIRYDSPNYKGFTAALQYATRDDTGNTTGTPFGGNQGDHPSVLRHAFVFGGNIFYANGPLTAGVAFERNEKVRQYTGDVFAPPSAPVNSGSPFNANDTDWSIGAAYDFGDSLRFAPRVSAIYEHTLYQTPTGNLTRNFWGIAGSVYFGGGKLSVLYGSASNGDGGAAEGENVGYLVKGPNTGTKQIDVAYTYALSPRTSVYAGYVKLVNQCKAPYAFDINAYPIAVGQVNAAPGSAGDFCSGQPSGLALGMFMLF